MERKINENTGKGIVEQGNIPNRKTRKAILEGRRLARKKNVKAYESMEDFRASLGL